MLLAVWFACAFIGLLFGNAKGKGAAGFFLGLFLGPIGVLIIAVVASSSGSTLDRIQARPAEAGWHPDPLGRFDGRYFDGKAWTQHVGRVDADGTRRTLEDPI